MAFLANGGNVYYTDSQGADPGPVERNAGYIEIFPSDTIDLSPDGGFLLYISYIFKSFGEWYSVIIEGRWGKPFRSWQDNPLQGEYFKESALDVLGEKWATRLYSPRWSPDGSQILFARSNELLVLEPDEGIIQQISVGSEVIEYCDWAPHGRFVASNRTGEIWITDGSSSQLLGKGFNPDVSPDESKIAFLQDDGEKSIWTMDLDGTNRKLMVDYVRSVPTRKRGFYFAWSPDSREIAFFTPDEIRAVSLFDGTVRSVLNIEGAGITSISWSPAWGAETGTGVSPASWGQVKSASADTFPVAPDGS